MNEKKTIISLSLLLLNDLFRTKVIDKDIYDKTAQKILSVKSTNPVINQPTMPRTA